MEGRNIQGMPPQNYGELKQTNIEKAIAQARLDGKQEALFNAISNVVRASAKDLYGTPDERKTRYVVDLIIKRVTALLSTDSVSADKVKEIIDDALKTEYQDLEDKASQNAKKLDEIKQLFKDSISSSKSTKSSENEIGSGLDATKTSLMSQQSKAGIESNIAKFTKTTEQLQKHIQQQIKSIQGVNTAVGSNVADQLIKSTNKAALANADSIQNAVSTAIQDNTQSIAEEVAKTTKKSLGSYLVDKVLMPVWNTVKKPFVFAFQKIISPLFKKLVLQPIKSLFKATYKMLLSPLTFIKDSVTKLIKGLMSGAFNILGAFLKTPAGMLALGFTVGFIWTKWIAPFWNKLTKFYDEYIVPIIQPLKDWFDGKIDFSTAMKKSWDIIKKEVWTDWLEKKLDAWKEEFKKYLKENHPALFDAANWVRNNPITATTLAALSAIILRHPFTAIRTTLKGLSWLAGKPKAIVSLIKGFWAKITGKAAETAVKNATKVAAKSTTTAARYSAEELAKHGLRLNKAGRVIDSAGHFVSNEAIEKLGIKVAQKVAKQTAEQGAKLTAKSASKFVPGLAVAVSGLDFYDSWANLKKGNFKSSAAFLGAGLTGAAGGILGLSGVGYPIQAALAAASTAMSVAGAAGEITEMLSEESKLQEEQTERLQQISQSFKENADIKLASNTDQLEYDANISDEFKESYIGGIDDIRTLITTDNGKLMYLLNEILRYLKLRNADQLNQNYLFISPGSADFSSTKIGVNQ